MTQKAKVGELKTQKNKNLGVDLLIGEIPKLIRPNISKREKIVDVYQYTDENGNIQYELVKQREGEPYLCRQPIGDGEYEYSIQNVRRVIYNLPAVLEAIKKGEVIFITEGESKVDTLSELGITATTVFSKSTNKWKEYYNQFLDGARGVIILALTLNNVEFTEYKPKEVKSQITGNGNANKDAMMKMVNLFTGSNIIQDDTADAVAIALAHASRNRIFK